MGGRVRGELVLLRKKTRKTPELKHGDRGPSKSHPEEASGKRADLNLVEGEPSAWTNKDWAAKAKPPCQTGSKK